MELAGKKIMVIAPHPDDEVIGCGGLLDAARRLGCEVFVLYACVGSSRQLVTGSTNENVRLKEVEAVAKELGFGYKVIFVGSDFMRLDAKPQKELIDPIEDALAEFAPDVVCIPPAGSYDQDHRAVHSACMTALRPVPRGLRHFVPFVLVYEEPYSWNLGGSFKPNFYLDVSGFEERKAELMKLHATQDRAPPFSRSGENLVRYLRIRGAEVGVKAAEAYRLVRGVFG